MRRVSSGLILLRIGVLGNALAAPLSLYSGRSLDELSSVFPVNSA